MKKDFSQSSPLNSVGSAVEIMEKMNADYLLIEEERKIKGLVTSREIVGYPSSRLILDSVIQPISTISGETLLDEALKVLEEKKVSFLVVLNKQGMPIGVINQEIIIHSLFQELKKLNKKKDKYISKLERVEEQLRKTYQELSNTHVQLVQTGKLAAMGEMAAGVAHELTQPLLGIKGFAAALLEDMKCQLQIEKCRTRDAELKIEDKSKIYQRAVADLELILQQIERMTKIMKMIRDFARSSGTEMVALDVNQPLEDALLLFSEQLRLHNVVVEKNLAPGLPRVLGNANQLQQVFINLITNSRDAIDSKGTGGRLTASTRVSSTGDSILIEFGDTGAGADAETVNRMFEPFFTTKTAGKGTGLGLSIAERIVREHEGTVGVESELGRGCRFTIQLPIDS